MRRAATNERGATPYDYAKELQKRMREQNRLDVARIYEGIRLNLSYRGARTDIKARYQTRRMEIRADRSSDLVGPSRAAAEFELAHNEALVELDGDHQNGETAIPIGKLAELLHRTSEQRSNRSNCGSKSLLLRPSLGRTLGARDARPITA